MNKETIIQRKIMLALSEAGCTVWRNETAGAWIGKVVHKAGNQVTLADARLNKFGLCIGSSDLIGVYRGMFVAIEVKTSTGKPTKEQLNFLEQVRVNGGLAGIARSPEEALEIINGK